MSEISWFGKRRYSMQHYAREHILYNALAGGTSSDELIELAETLETFNDVRNEHPDATEEFISEVSQAIAMEVVYRRDRALVDRLMDKADSVQDFFIHQNCFSENISKAGDDLVNTISASVCKLPNGNKFIIVNPLIVAVLQSIPTSNFAPNVGEAFKGPMNTMNVGSLDGVPIYSYIFPIPSSSSKVGEIIVGNYDEKAETFVTKVTHVHSGS